MAALAGRTLHSDRPCFGVGAVRPADGLFGAFACTLGADFCAGYPRAKEDFARFGAHGCITAQQRAMPLGIRYPEKPSGPAGSVNMHQRNQGAIRRLFVSYIPK